MGVYCTRKPLPQRASWIQVNMNVNGVPATIPDDGTMMDLRIKVSETQLPTRKALPSDKGVNK